MTDDVIPLNEIGKIGTVKVYNQAYVDKQQKRIADLEKENAEAKERIKTLEYRCENIKDTDTMELVALQRENAELKTDYEVLSCSVGDFEELQDKLEEEQRKNNGLSDNLTKAKEIINDLVHLGEFNEHTDEEHTNYQVHEVLKNAEQFLKDCEIEK